MEMLRVTLVNDYAAKNLATRAASFPQGFPALAFDDDARQRHVICTHAPRSLMRRRPRASSK